MHLAAALRGAGRHDDAREKLRQIRRTRPVEPGLHLLAGELSEAIGDSEEAAAILEAQQVIASMSDRSGPSPEPVAANGLAAVLSRDGDVYCIDLVTV